MNFLMAMSMPRLDAVNGSEKALRMSNIFKCSPGGHSENALHTSAALLRDKEVHEGYDIQNQHKFLESDTSPDSDSLHESTSVTTIDNTENFDTFLPIDPPKCVPSTLSWDLSSLLAKLPPTSWNTKIADIPSAWPTLERWTETPAASSYPFRYPFLQR
jgi:hypothetical protein